MSGQPTSTPMQIRGTFAPRQIVTAPERLGRLLQNKYRALTRKHLDRIFSKLFAEFTGLHFHVAWAPSANHDWTAPTLPTGCSVCCRLQGAPLLRSCRTCGPRQLARALRATGSGPGLQFNCRLGVRNYWIPIRVREVTVAIAYLQALTHPPRRKRAQPQETKVMRATEFHRAGQLLRLIVQHVQTLDLAELRQAELRSAGHALVALEKEQARLHEALERHLPATPPLACRPSRQSHPEQLVQRLLNWIEQNYAQPLTLRSCAAQLARNAAYLSALFSEHCGVSFKACLTERRLEKAKALLGNPALNISEVASAVGYASENRFRIAFKKAHGLAPKLWRETVQAQPSHP